MHPSTTYVVPRRLSPLKRVAARPSIARVRCESHSAARPRSPLAGHGSGSSNVNIESPTNSLRRLATSASSVRARILSSFASFMRTRSYSTRERDAAGLSPSAVQRRLKRYRRSGLVRQEIAVLDPDALPGTTLACVLVSFERESKRLHGGFQERMRAAPEVQQCYELSGDWDYLVILATDGMAHCRAVLDDLFLDASNIKRYSTLFVFGVVKSGLNIPLSKL
jgi:Lrp/AsnC family leucine-responsive transcriptional regulator